MDAAGAAATSSTRDIVEEAWRRGRTFDLSRIGYGRIHWGNKADIVSHPFSYYYFLAGLVNLLGCRRIVEIGTHQGGSALAMAAGLADAAGGRIVTFDITPDGTARFAGHPVIRAFRLDANSSAAYEACLAEIGDARIDLVYIDAVHDFWPTMLSAAVYGLWMRARFLVLDDITLNAGMLRAWTSLRSRFGDDAVDATEIVPQIRPPSDGTRPGFGFVRLPA